MDGEGGACVICLDSEPAPIQSGCACRSDAGLAHVACMARYAASGGGWRVCRTCKRPFTGRMLVGLAEARWAAARRLDRRVYHERIGAMRHVVAAHAERGRYTDAVRLARDAHDAAVEAYGAAHETSLVVALELANVLHMQGDVAASVEAHRGVVETRAAALGEAHPSTLAARASLASCMSDGGTVGELEWAERVQRRMLDEETHTLGARHIDTLTTRCDLALTLAALKRHGEARVAYDGLVPVLETELGREHPMTIVTRGNMAACVAADGDARAAEDMLRGVVRSARRIFGTVHPDTRAAQRNLRLMRARLRREAAATQRASGKCN